LLSSIYTTHAISTTHLRDDRHRAFRRHLIQKLGATITPAHGAPHRRLPALAERRRMLPMASPNPLQQPLAAMPIPDMFMKASPCASGSPCSPL